MTKEELKNKAKEFVSKIASGTSQEMDYYVHILVEFANETIKELEAENEKLKDKNKALEQYADLAEEKVDETQELLDKQIEATYKVVEKLNKAKEIIRALLNIFVYDLPNDELDSVDIVYKERAEKFLKED